MSKFISDELLAVACAAYENCPNGGHGYVNAVGMRAVLTVVMRVASLYPDVSDEILASL